METTKKKLTKIALSLMLLAPALSGCDNGLDNNQPEKEEVSDVLYHVEEDEKTPLQKKMDSYKDYQEIDPNEEVDHKYLEQVKNQMVVTRVHIYTRFDDYGIRNYAGTYEDVKNRWSETNNTVDYVKTLIVPTYFRYVENLNDWVKIYDAGAVVDGEAIYSSCDNEFRYTSNEELDRIFGDEKEEYGKQFRLNKKGQ